MTHPQEAVEAVARALYVESWTGWIAPAWAELGEDGRGHWIARATALLDQIAPHYREQAAQFLDHAVSIFPVVIHRKEILRSRTGAGEHLDTAQGYVTKEDCLQYGANIAAAIRKGE